MSRTVSQALHRVCGFLEKACHFVIKSRHKKKKAADGYQKLSWHVTFLARAPLQEWRMAMKYIEQNVSGLRLCALVWLVF